MFTVWSWILLLVLFLRYTLTKNHDFSSSKSHFSYEFFIIKLALKHGLRLVEKQRFDEFYSESVQSSRGLIEKIQVLETFLGQSQDERERQQNVGEYSHAQGHLDQKGASGSRFQKVGTLSKSEWEASTLYMFFAFQKMKTNWDKNGKPGQACAGGDLYGDSEPRYMRSSMFNLPINTNMMKLSAVLFELVVSPFAHAVEKKTGPTDGQFWLVGTNSMHLLFSSVFCARQRQKFQQIHTVDERQERARLRSMKLHQIVVVGDVQGNVHAMLFTLRLLSLSLNSEMRKCR
ncbi:mRNA (guanine-7-)methyltransferase [Culex quinquefasciatus]|uniref:mRNA (Guanine-7-)methyltransferase n=1 Tax=Culex quinquefasciatus TaxID=7176 RepID=B0XI05_CULQU|nr:mRNA (guanine-7-)methyltransferase [Culex quinquefasciatus]|eukprot:XP_001869277.1 mRNA (guanine-7-)methyltransferase [Culex quinquefasciatus]